MAVRLRNGVVVWSNVPRSLDSAGLRLRARWSRPECPPLNFGGAGFHLARSRDAASFGGAGRAVLLSQDRCPPHKRELRNAAQRFEEAAGNIKGQVCGPHVNRWSLHLLAPLEMRPSANPQKTQCVTSNIAFFAFGGKIPP
jgi:hypothetical protein